MNVTDTGTEQGAELAGNTPSRRAPVRRKSKAGEKAVGRKYSIRSVTLPDDRHGADRRARVCRRSPHPARRGLVARLRMGRVDRSSDAGASD